MSILSSDPTPGFPKPLLLLPLVACIEIGDIKVTIVDDTAITVGDSGGEVDSEETDDTRPEDSADTAQDSGETGTPEEEPVYEAPDSFTGPPLGDDVLIYQGLGALPVDSGEYLIDGVDELVDLYLSLGATTTITDIWPEDPSDYRLVLWYLPGAGEEAGFEFPEETLLSLLDWLGRGGRLVLAGDVDGEYGGYSLTQGNLTIDYLLRRMGADIRLSEPLAETVACEGTPDSDLLSTGDPIAAYLGHNLEIGPAASWVYCDGIAVQNIWCGDVVVTGDVNLISDRPDVAPELVQNLYSVPVESTCSD